MRILVTGGTGYVGRHLLARLADSHEPVALARREPPEELRGLADWIEVDLARPLDQARLPDRVDAVVHLAQSARYRDLPEGAADVFAVNVASTFGLLDLARRTGAERFVHASSGSVYPAGPELLDESTPPAPRGFYGASKAAAERLVTGYPGPAHTAVLRPFFVYGPGQTGMLLPTLAHRVLEGEAVEVAGDPGIRVSPTYVDDAVRAFAAALDLEGHHVCNVAGDEAVSITELVRLIGRAAGVTPDVRHVAAGAGADLVADTRHMRELLGVVPEVRLEEGIRRMVAQARAEHRLPAG